VQIDTPNINWSSLDRYFAVSPQVDDALPDNLVDARIASTWQDQAGSGPIREERDDFFVASI
jgi:hypothetical protein